MHMLACTQTQTHTHEQLPGAKRHADILLSNDLLVYPLPLLKETLPCTQIHSALKGQHTPVLMEVTASAAGQHLLLVLVWPHSE